MESLGGSLLYAVQCWLVLLTEAESWGCSVYALGMSFMPEAALAMQIEKPNKSLLHD